MHTVLELSSDCYKNEIFLCYVWKYSKYIDRFFFIKFFILLKEKLTMLFDTHAHLNAEQLCRRFGRSY